MWSSNLRLDRVSLRLLHYAINDRYVARCPLHTEKNTRTSHATNYTINNVVCCYVYLFTWWRTCVLVCVCIDNCALTVAWHCCLMVIINNATTYQCQVKVHQTDWPEIWGCKWSHCYQDAAQMVQRWYGSWQVQWTCICSIYAQSHSRSLSVYITLTFIVARVCDVDATYVMWWFAACI